MNVLTFLKFVHYFIFRYFASIIVGEQYAAIVVHILYNRFNPLNQGWIIFSGIYRLELSKQYFHHFRNTTHR